MLQRTATLRAKRILWLDFARWLVAPMNAIPQVKEAVLRQNGFVSEKHCGYGVAHGLATILKNAGYALEHLADRVSSPGKKG